MKATIIASEHFLKFIELHKKEIQLIKTKNVESDGTYDSNLSGNVSNYLISFVIGVSSSYVSTLLKEYVEEKKENIEVRLKENVYNLNPNNLNQIIPEINTQFVITLDEEIKNENRKL